MDGPGRGPGGRDQRAHGPQVAGALAGRRRARAAGSLARRRTRWPTAPTSARIAGDRGVAPVAHSPARRSPSARDAALDGLGHPDADRDGPPRPARAASPPERYERARPGELIHIDVKKLGRIVGGAGHRVTGRSARRHGRLTDRRAQPQPPAGSSCTSPSTTPPAWPTSSPRRRDGHDGDRVPAPRGRVLRQLRHHRRGVMTDNGSAYRSTIHAIACRALGLRHLRTRPYRAPDQRQGRALHPHHARRLGLRRDLRAQATNAPQPLTAGCSPTTIADDTQASGDKHPSPA